MNQNKIVVNFLWRLMERVGAQLVSFIVTIILARILAPEDYGEVALLTVFTAVLQVFVDSGMSSALIQKKKVDNIDYSSVFFFNLICCTLLYILLFWAAPLIGRLFHNEDLIIHLRVLGLILIISGIKNIQQAYVSRNMMFKRFFFSTLIGTIVAAMVGIFLAIKGYGAWALIIQYLTNNAIDTCILWITVKWRPEIVFSWDRVKTLLKYGWKILASTLVDKLYSEMRQLIIGGMYTTSDLAFYNRGNQFPALIVDNINSSINSILLPTMSAVQESRDRVRNMTRKAIITSSYIIMPLMCGLAICCEPFIRIVLTDKWIPAIPYLRIFCFTYAFYPIHTANLNAIKSLGRSDLFLKLEIIKKVIGLSVLAFSVKHGVFIIALSLLIVSICSQIINSWPNKELLDYSYKDQLVDMLPNILLSICMMIPISLLSKIIRNDYLLLFAQVTCGSVVYFSLSSLFKVKGFSYICDIAKGFLGKKQR